MEKLNSNNFIIEIERMYKNVSTEEIRDRMCECLDKNGIYDRKEKIKKAAEITDSSIHTVSAWFNMSRGIRIPLLKLCDFCNYYNEDVINYIGGRNMERKIVVFKVKGDMEEVDIIYELDMKEQAIRMAKIRKQSEPNFMFVVAECMYAYGKVSTNHKRVLEVFD